MWLITKRDVYLVTYKYWLPIFAVAFAMGFVSGIDRITNIRLGYNPGGK